MRPIGGRRGDRVGEQGTEQRQIHAGHRSFYSFSPDNWSSTTQQCTSGDIHGYYRARVEHLPAFGLQRLCVTFDWGPMNMIAVCACASPEVGGFQGGHRKIELLIGAVRALCPRRNTPWVQTTFHLPSKLKCMGGLFYCTAHRREDGNKHCTPVFNQLCVCLAQARPFGSADLSCV